MKKKLLPLLIISFITLNIFSQTQQQVWYLDNQSIDFSSPTPVLTQGLIGNSNVIQPQTRSSKNGVHNQNGDLLFFIVDNVVYDKNSIFIGGLL